MCIIAIKIKGADFIPTDTVINCLVNNPDGFSMAWNENGELRTFRTMDRKEFVREYVSLTERLDRNTTAMILHARIATHGSVKIENCHCWTGAGLAFAHNGVLHNIPNRDDLTDSETFFRDYFLPVYEKCGMDTAARLAKAIAGTSKFAFMDKDGNLGLIGDYRKTELPDCKGHFYFSNGSYVARSSYYSEPAKFPPLPFEPRKTMPISVSRDEKGRVIYSTQKKGQGTKTKTAKKDKEATPSLFGKDGKLVPSII